MKQLYIIILLAIVVAVQSCFKLESYPNEPKVEYLDFILVDTLDKLGNVIKQGTLQFAFTDGDGDIGFDTTTPLQNTIFLEKYKVEDGELSLIELFVPLNYYIPKYENLEEGKPLKGEMLVTDINEIYPYVSDTILYTFYIVDRAGNVSNMDTTEYIYYID